MNKITSIHLNGKAYQLEEQAFDALRHYLDQAAAKLANNPDKQEILADLEQAIGEKCGRFLNPGKDVIQASEIEQILTEMGPVNGEASDTKKTEQPKDNNHQNNPKRLYLILEGAWISGVCTGLAAYFDIDVTIVRVAFIVLTILTGGAWALVYLALMFLVPYANTAEDRAAAHGEIFNAQEVVNRAKEAYSRVADKQEWKSWKNEWHKQRHEWRKQHQALRHQGRQMAWQARYQPYQSYGASPFMGVLSAVLSIVWIVALISLIKTGAIFGIAIPAAIPLWAAIVILFIVFHAVTGPMRSARYMQLPNGQWQMNPHNGFHGIVDGLGVLFVFIACGFAYLHYPQVHEFVNHIPQYIQEGIDKIRN